MNANEITTNKQTAFNNLCEYVDGLGCLAGSSLAELVDVDDFDTLGGITDADDLENKITCSSNPFDEEIIYYSRALDYLRENDPSLRESLELAAGMGYSAGALNSELLASILASEKNRETWSNHRDKITELIEAINDADELDEDDENE